MTDHFNQKLIPVCIFLWSLPSHSSKCIFVIFWTPSLAAIDPILDIWREGKSRCYVWMRLKTRRDTKWKCVASRVRLIDNQMTGSCTWEPVFVMRSVMLSCNPWRMVHSHSLSEVNVGSKSTGSPLNWHSLDNDGWTRSTDRFSDLPEWIHSSYELWKIVRAHKTSRNSDSTSYLVVVFVLCLISYFSQIWLSLN